MNRDLNEVREYTPQISGGIVRRPVWLEQSE